MPQVFSDNSAVLAVGLQSALANTGVVVYAEAGIALNLMSQGPRAAPDYRGGIHWFRSWGPGLIQAGNTSRTVSLTGNVYADVAYYSRYDDNVIGYLQLREGLNLPTPRVMPIQLLAAINFVKDSKGQFYNNAVETGPELRIALVRLLSGLSLEAQYLRGFYTTHDSRNPYAPRYGDVRVSLVWSRTF